MPSWASSAAIVLALWAFYLAIFLHYRPYEIDNPWFLSFSYNFCVEHVYTDQFMGITFPGGMDGTLLFGKLAAYSQCAVVGAFGWQQWAASLLSATLVAFGLTMWAWQLRRLGLGQRFIACFLVTAGLLEPVLSASNRFRFESLAFALIASGLALIAARRPLLGMFVAGLAMEVEPAGIAGILPAVLLAYFLVRREKLPARVFFLKLAAGFLLAVAAYFALHPDVFHIAGYLHQVKTVNQIDGGILRSYFFNRPRHLPELAGFLVAAVFYLKRRRSIPLHYFGASALALMLFAFFMPHGNEAYMIFVYPSLVAMALTAFQAERRPWLIVGVILLYVLPQQIYLAWLTRGLGFRTADIASVSQAIRAAADRQHLPDSTLRIFGDYRLYFAHPHLFRAAYAVSIPQIRDADLYLCYETPPQPATLEPAFILYCPLLRSLAPMHPVTTIDVRGSRIFIYAPQ